MICPNQQSKQSVRIVYLVSFEVISIEFQMFEFIIMFIVDIERNL